GFAPPEPPPAGALLFAPPAVGWLPAASHDMIAASVDDWDRAHPLTDGVRWHDLRIKRAAVRVSADAPEHNVVSAKDGALIVTGKAAAPWIVVGFTPQASNLVLQPGFPILVGNALAWLSDVDPPVARGIGTVHVPLSGASVVDGNG